MPLRILLSHLSITWPSSLFLFFLAYWTMRDGRFNLSKTFKTPNHPTVFLEICKVFHVVVGKANLSSTRSRILEASSSGSSLSFPLGPVCLGNWFHYIKGKNGDLYVRSGTHIFPFRVATADWSNTRTLQTWWLLLYSWRFIWVYFIIISLRLPSYSFSKKETDVLWMKLKLKPFSLIHVLTRKILKHKKEFAPSNNFSDFNGCKWIKWFKKEHAFHRCQRHRHRQKKVNNGGDYCVRCHFAGRLGAFVRGSSSGGRLSAAGG